VTGGGGFDVGREAIERGAIGVELGGPLLGDGGERAALLAGAADGFVVHIGEVAHVLHLAGEFEVEEAAEEIVDDKSAEIADVGGGVNGGAAVVETVNAIGLGGGERARGAGKRVVELDGHFEDRVTKLQNDRATKTERRIESVNENENENDDGGRGGGAAR
jgi:hypothetical protein